MDNYLDDIWIFRQAPFPAHPDLVFPHLHRTGRFAAQSRSAAKTELQLIIETTSNLTSTFRLRPPSHHRRVLVLLQAHRHLPLSVIPTKSALVRGWNHPMVSITYSKSPGVIDEVFESLKLIEVTLKPSRAQKVLAMETAKMIPAHADADFTSQSHRRHHRPSQQCHQSSPSTCTDGRINQSSNTHVTPQSRKMCLTINKMTTTIQGNRNQMKRISQIKTVWRFATNGAGSRNPNS